jgi:predicted DCC family thiol-disulfide oxidoreductase YuxK
MIKPEQQIVFYDGDCGFCNRSVQFVLKYERKKEIFFSALQSDFAVQFFEEHQFSKPDLQTFYFYEKGGLLEKSRAAFALLKYMRYPIRLLVVFSLVPHVISDSVYDFIAKRRHKISKGFCVLPSPEERIRFLSEK